jgi:hypothetical protein
MVRAGGNLMLVAHQQLPAYVEALHEYAADGFADRSPQPHIQIFDIKVSDTLYHPALRDVEYVALVYRR